MNKVFIVVTTIASLALAGVLFAVSSASKNIQAAARADAGIDILSLSKGARNLPEQNYPAY
jgi:hypothetical protein